MRDAHIGQFKPIADFQWDWPTHCDRALIEELMTLAFLEDAGNIVLVGPTQQQSPCRSAVRTHQPPHQHNSTLITNRAFADWGEVFPNAASARSKPAAMPKLAAPKKADKR